MFLGGDFESCKKQFGLFQDSKGVWRCRGRLGNIEAPYAVKYPILILKAHPLAMLIVRQAHVRVCHNGPKETLAEMRAKYWIPRGRRFVREIVHQCVVCRRFEGLALKTAPSPPLPECRVREAPAFSFRGIDFAGPFMVCTDQTSQSRKVWMSLFTCYVTGAVHLDTVPDQSTTAFIRCLKRFTARRGIPKQFISDNVKTFKATAQYLDAVFKDDLVQVHLAKLGVTWRFNLERAPWWGGAFERLVRSTKRCLKKVIGRAHLSLDELTTMLAEIEAVLNSRPLAYVSADDEEEPITPSHLIVGRWILSLPDDLDQEYDLDDLEFTLKDDQVARRVQHLNQVLNHFWKRWRSEYLSCLREVHALASRKQKNNTNSPVSVGEVVIVRDEQLPCGLWKLGIVQEVLKGRDGLVRAAIIKISSPNRPCSILKRPVQFLYPLEISSASVSPVATQDSDHSKSSSAEKKEDSADTTNQVRPRRAAARGADKVRRAWIAQLEDHEYET